MMLLLLARLIAANSEQTFVRCKGPSLAQGRVFGFVAKPLLRVLRTSRPPGFGPCVTQLCRLPSPTSTDHLPSCSTTASHNEIVSAFAARSDGIWRTAVCTMISLEAGSTSII